MNNRVTLPRTSEIAQWLAQCPSLPIEWVNEMAREPNGVSVSVEFNLAVTWQRPEPPLPTTLPLNVTPEQFVSIAGPQKNSPLFELFKQGLARPHVLLFSPQQKGNPFGFVYKRRFDTVYDPRLLYEICPEAIGRECIFAIYSQATEEQARAAYDAAHPPNKLSITPGEKAPWA
jgi:hypothetical protein